MRKLLLFKNLLYKEMIEIQQKFKIDFNLITNNTLFIFYLFGIRLINSRYIY